jgi:phosphoenolpyruvate carboxykinase (GTP)
MSSETTAASEGSLGNLRHDPFGMLPFCSYHMGDYFSHWLEMEQNATSLPKIFSVNWFLKDSEGKFLWPGFGENIHVLKWIFERTSGTTDAKETPIGLLPQDGVFSPPELTQINTKEYQKELENLSEYFKLFGERFPKELTEELEQIQKKLSSF